jgi:hypothetical protein
MEFLRVIPDVLNLSVETGRAFEHMSLSRAKIAGYFRIAYMTEFHPLSSPST